MPGFNIELVPIGELPDEALLMARSDAFEVYMIGVGPIHSSVSLPVNCGQGTSNLRE
jgi:hypothetical protein